MGGSEAGSLMVFEVPAAWVIRAVGPACDRLSGPGATVTVQPFRGLTRSVDVEHGLAADAPVQQGVDRTTGLAP
jgi:hypothetical protein